jgi:hypothetical protein
MKVMEAVSNKREGSLEDKLVKGDRGESKCGGGSELDGD